MSEHSSMLRSPLEAAVSEIGRRAQEIADHYRQSAALLDGAPLAGRFETWAQAHEVIAQRMARASERLGDLPRLPDPDREAFHALVRGVKSVFAQDEAAALVAERLGDERALLADIDRALGLEAGTEWDAQFADARGTVAEILRELSAAPAG